MIETALQQAAELLVNQLLKTKKDETFVITADTEADESVIEYIARAAARAGAKLMTVLIPTPRGVSTDADPDLPVDALSAMLGEADIWIELNSKWLLYSTPFYRAKKSNPRMRHVCLTGAGASTLIRCMGKVDYEVMSRFSKCLCKKIQQAKEVRMVAENGDEIRFSNLPGRPVPCKLGNADVPGTHLFVGQMSWVPEQESVNGVICLNGSIAPGIGILSSPVRITVKNGAVTAIEGEGQAQEYASWLKSFGHPQMLRISHTGIGFNPGAKLAGEILQDQRVWGSTTWAFGSIGAGLLPPDGVDAPSHSDAVSVGTDIYLDGKPLWLHGEVADAELAPLAKELLKSY